MNKNEFLPKIEKSIKTLKALAASIIVGNNNVKTEYYKHLMSKIEGLELAKSYFKEIDWCQEYNICWKEGE